MTEQSPTRVVAETVRVGAMRGGKEETKKALFAGGGVLGAITMTSCCIMPLVLFSLGATGAWIGGLAALYPYRWIFFLVTAGFVGGAPLRSMRHHRRHRPDYCSVVPGRRLNARKTDFRILADRSMKYRTTIFLASIRRSAKSSADVHDRPGGSVSLKTSKAVR